MKSESLGGDCWEVIINYGFKNEPDVPAALAQLRTLGCTFEAMSTSYFLSQ